jgi:hypothetical protein
MLSLWLLYSGVFAGYGAGRKEAFTLNSIAVALAVVGCLVGLWMVVLAIPEFLQLIQQGRIDHAAASAVVAAGSFLFGILGGFAWGRFAQS